jgi:hypothetical protein
MLKQLSALLVALVVALATFVWVESYSSSFQHCISQTTNKPSENKSENQIATAIIVPFSYIRCTERFADRHNALITALATVLLGVITFGLILSGADQQRTTRAQLRAYLTVEPGKSFRQSRKRNFRFELRPFVINVGQTPASNVRILSNINFLAPPIPPDFNFKLIVPENFPPGSRATIGPGKDKHHSVAIGRLLTWRELRDHVVAKKWFHVWGVVTYTDVFSIERHTYFSYLVYFPTKISQEVTWNTTDRHNYYD